MPSFWDKVSGFPYESIILRLDRDLRSLVVIKEKNDFARAIGGAWWRSHNASWWADRHMQSFHGWMLEVKDKHAFI